MNRFFALLVCAFIGHTAFAQTVTVKSQSERVKGESCDGYGTELVGKKESVSGAWVKFLKEIGKVKQSSDPMTITEPTFNGLSFSNSVYALLSQKGESTYVWLGILPTEWEAANVKRVNNELEKAIHQFGVKYYHDKIQLQIDEAQAALEAVERQKQRITNQTRDLTIQLGNNEQEMIELNKSVEINKVENISIKDKLARNVKAQDSLAAAGVQIQKVKQSHADRQKKVN